MPVMGGVAAVKAIRESDPFTYILLISGEAEKAEIKEALSNGADKFLGKPFTNEALLDIIDKIDFAKIKLKKYNAAEDEQKQTARSYGFIRRIFNSHRLYMLRPKLVELTVLVVAGLIAGALALFLGSMPVSSPDSGSDFGSVKSKIDNSKIDKIEQYLKSAESRELSR
jgi:CheY-like chemotaxis protein